MFGLFDPIEDGAIALDKAFAETPEANRAAIGAALKDILIVMRHHEAVFDTLVQNAALCDAFIGLIPTVAVRIAKKRTDGLIPELLSHCPTLAVALADVLTP